MQKLGSIKDQPTAHLDPIPSTIEKSALYHFASGPCITLLTACATRIYNSSIQLFHNHLNVLTR